MKTSARALLAVGALLVFLIGLAIVLVFAPRDANQVSGTAASPNEKDAPRDAANSTPDVAVTQDTRTSTESEQVRDVPPLDDLFALLAWLEKPGRGPLPAVVDDPGKFERYFASQNRER